MKIQVPGDSETIRNPRELLTESIVSKRHEYLTIQRQLFNCLIELSFIIAVDKE